MAQLAQGERLFLPGEVVAILDQMRAIGISGPSVRMERDGWIMLNALSPQLVAGWAHEKSAALADPAFQRLYLAFDQARDWDPADPRIRQLAAQGRDWVMHHARSDTERAEPTSGLSLVAGLLEAQLAEASPALGRLTKE